MQLVVMAAVLALAGARQGCNFRCQLINLSIPVKSSCGRVESVYTTICAGQCPNEDPVYLSHADGVKQKTCNGDWFYAVQHIQGCQVTYPVARSCNCTTCNGGDTDCIELPGDIRSCLSF